MDEMQSVTLDDLAATRARFSADRANVIAKNAVTAQGIREVARVPEAVAANTATFDVEVRQGKRCDQKRSGRCWMFASLNTIRARIIERYNLKTYELSRPTRSSSTRSRRATGFSRTSSTRSTSGWTAALWRTCSPTPSPTAASGTCSARS